MDTEFPISLFQLFCTALIVLGCSIISSAVGFGFGTFAIPLLIVAGLTLPHSVALSIGGIFIQSMFTTWYLRDDLLWRPAVRASIVRILTIPVGAYMMLQIDQAGVEQTKQVIGTVLLIIVFVSYFTRIHQRRSIHSAWEAPAFVCSGILGGMIGMAGPPMVLWVVSQNWTNPQIRSFLQFNFLTTAPLQIILMAAVFGTDMLIVSAIGVICVPVLYIGTSVGLSIGGRFSRRTLDLLSLLLLSLLALSTLVEQVFQ